jgi:hypothetical protein
MSSQQPFSPAFCATFVPGASTVPRAEAVMLVIRMSSRHSTATRRETEAVSLCLASLRRLASFAWWRCRRSFAWMRFFEPLAFRATAFCSVAVRRCSLSETRGRS